MLCHHQHYTDMDILMHDPLLMENVTFHIKDMGLDRPNKYAEKLPNSKQRVLTEDLMVVQLAKKYSALYETHKLISTIMTTTTAPYLESCPFVMPK